MEYNTSAVNSSYNMQPKAYFQIPIGSLIFRVLQSLMSHFLPWFTTRRWLRKQSSDTRCRSIFHAKDITRTYRNQSMSSSETDFAGYLDVATSGLGAICGPISSCHGNTSANNTNNQRQRILLNFYSVHHGIMYVIESKYMKVRKIKCIYIYSNRKFLCYP